MIILFVEDDLMLREAIASSLRDVGHTVLEAASGEDAIAISERHDKIDVLITDIQLVGSLSGWDVAEALRARNKEIAVIYASGRAMLKSRTVPNSVYFSKPYSVESVVSACCRVAGLPP